MERVLVIGSGGAGKTTLARRVAEAAALPLVHLDRLYWRAGWEPTPPEEWEGVVTELIAEPRWVIDGNYGGTLELRAAAADTIVFLDVRRLRCLIRVAERTWRHRGRSREDVAEGCDEHLTWEFIRWIWQYPVRRRTGIIELLARFERKGGRSVILRDAHGIDAFLRAVHVEAIGAGEYAGM